MSDCYREPCGPESSYIDCTQKHINQQQDVINQELLEQIQYTQARLNEVFKWITNHETIHAASAAGI